MHNELLDRKNSAKTTYEDCQKQYEALITGLEINDEGQAETLLEQLASMYSNFKFTIKEKDEF